MRMTKEHKKIIREKLIPFIQREDGNAFAMVRWFAYFPPPSRWLKIDGVTHKKPSCGTTQCIGGSLEMILNSGKEPDEKIYSWEGLGEAIGLNENRTNTLFYGWRKNWPEPFRTKYARARTASNKARIAAELLEAVAVTGGKILDPSPLEIEFEL